MKIFFLLLLSATFSQACSTLHTSSSSSEDKKNSEELTREILTNGQAYSNLKELVSGGSRLSGSDNAARAVEWAKAKMESYGFDRVWLQEVMVPHWVRGVRGSHEDAVFTQGAKGHLKVAALGNSVGTGKNGIDGEVVEVSSVKDAEEISKKTPEALKGKIVFYNGPMDPSFLDTFEAYHQAGSQRGQGPDVASSAGAVAVLVRSLTLSHDLHPHTGATWFKDDTKKIPSAAIATADADRLSELLKTGKIRLKLTLSAEKFPPVRSYNVIGEITGREIPEEFVDVGGHLDSWDLGPGAHDDGAGVVQSLEVLRALKTLKIKPKRSIRVVLFMAEEIDGSGAREYARQITLKKERHIAALESDSGGFSPHGFTTDASEAVLAKQGLAWKEVLAPLEADRFVPGEGGVDIQKLQPLGVMQFGLKPDSARYFDYHHAETDTLDAVNPRELSLGAAAMATLIYMISEHGVGP
jgi:carboxypeptidase Q